MKPTAAPIPAPPIPKMKANGNAIAAVELGRPNIISAIVPARMGVATPSPPMSAPVQGEIEARTVAARARTFTIPLSVYLQGFHRRANPPACKDHSWEVEHDPEEARNRILRDSRNSRQL